MIGTIVGGGDAKAVIAAIRMAESLGIGAAWLTTAGAGLDALTIFAAAARETDTIRLGASIVPTWPRHPIVVAQQAQVIEQLAPGRLIVGVGPSNRASMERLIGLRWDKPLEHLREYVSILKQLLQDGSVDYQGTRLTGRASIEAPVSMPVMIGALRQNAYRLGGEVADGAISWLTPWPFIKSTGLPALQAGADAARRDVPPLVYHVLVCQSSDVDAVRAAVRAQFGFYPRLPTYAAMFNDAGFPVGDGNLSDELIDAICVYGSEREIVEKLRSFEANGATDVICDPVLTDGTSPESAFRVIAAAAASS